MALQRTLTCLLAQLSNQRMLCDAVMEFAPGGDMYQHVKVCPYLLQSSSRWR